jgi:SAM-dependent MidA family methyltransferase
MECALYHPQSGYYTSAHQRSGRQGDFYTSVDVSSLFGEMLAIQIEEIWQRLGRGAMDVVEAGAGNGRLMRDVLDTLASEFPECYQSVRAAVVERSALARAQHAEVFARHQVQSLDTMPASIVGVLFANELLDALPVHVVTATPDGLREIYVGERDGTLVEVEGPLSDPRIAAQLARAGVEMREGTRGEVSLAAVDWVRDAAARLQRGVILLVDYGDEALRLYSSHRPEGTMTTYRQHRSGVRWLEHPGEYDLTSHVDFTSIRLAAEDAGLDPLGACDQMYFLQSLGLVQRLSAASDTAAVSRRLAAKTLMVPAGLGSTMKVIGFGRGLGDARLTGLSSGRLT